MKHFLQFEVVDGELKGIEVKGVEGKVPYEMMYDIFGNIIQYVYHVDLGGEGLAIVVDEEGLLKELKPTFWLYSKETKKVESFPLVGKVLVVKVKDGETYCLTDEEIELVKSKVMVDERYGNYFLPLDDEYIKRSNENMNAFLNMLNKDK